MDRVTAFMSLLEGHAEHVMDGVGPSVVPSVRHIRRRFDQRRKERGGVLDQLLRRLLGLDLKALQYAEGKVFVDTAVRELGMSGFNRVWESPATLPTRAEIRRRWTGCAGSTARRPSPPDPRPAMTGPPAQTAAVRVAVRRSLADVGEGRWPRRVGWGRLARPGRGGGRRAPRVVRPGGRPRAAAGSDAVAARRPGSALRSGCRRGSWRPRPARRRAVRRQRPARPATPPSTRRSATSG
jgi:hypothetical protein